jgi:arabinofuranan 3-O-arabinosyltransferase
VLVASSVFVAAVVFLQAPGRIVAETKLDVLLDPFGFLGRSLTAWDPYADLGRVQNQAAGYLFPMGAFTALGRLLRVPPWIVQRGWITLVVLLALWGAHRLAGAVGITAPRGRLVAAWAYALAPATVATVAFQSAGQLPYSLAPWVLLPLVRARASDRPRRVAARSGLAVVAMGGINGAAAFAVLPLVLVWFATRRPGGERRRLFGWWLGAVVAASLWWLVPLWVSVRYGLRFTAYTEQPSLTTSTESATEILRGTGNWLSYLPVGTDYWLRGARHLVVDRLAIVASVLVGAGGVLGLARRDQPGRRWLVPAALLGVVVMGAGYTGSGGGPFGLLVQDVLAGPLAPFRNVHKFAAVVRLPLALGLGHLVATFGARHTAEGPPTTSHDPAEGHDTTGEHAEAEVGDAADGPATQHVHAEVPVRTRRSVRQVRVAPAAVATVLVLASVLPGSTQLTAPGSFDGLPRAWRQAATWLDAHADGRRTLVLPASSFGEYTWGRPLDEPLASLMNTPWAVRNLIPLGGNGSTRLLDGIDRALDEDHLPSGFVAALQRAGIGHLLVRNDLDRGRTGGPAPESLRRVLGSAPTLRRTISFGPPTSPASDGRTGPRPGGSQAAPIRELDVYTVPGALDRIASYPASDALVVGGGPEALLDLPPATIAGRAVVLAVDEPRRGLVAPERSTTDTARRRDVDFGGVRNRTTYTLTATEPSPATGNAPDDRWPAGSPTGLSVARVVGAATLRSDEPIVGARPEQQPAAAFDGLDETAWVPADPTVGHWIEVGFDRPRRVDGVTVRLPAATGLRVASVTATTTVGSVTVPIGADGSVRIALPGGSTDRVRITVDSLVDGPPVAPLGLGEIELDGLRIGRPVVTAPVAPGGATGALADSAHLSRLRRDRFDRFRSSEESILDRIVGLRPGRYDLSGTASATPGPALDRLLDRPPDPSVLVAGASSRWQDLPTFDAANVVDGDPSTAWISDGQATPPRLSLRWPDQATISGLQLDSANGTDAISLVRVTVDGRTRTLAVPSSGRVRFPPVRTDHLDLTFPTEDPPGVFPRLIGLADLRVRGLTGRNATAGLAQRVGQDRSTQIVLACGTGPALRVDGQTVLTRATATVGQLLDAAPVPWTSCDPVGLAGGEHRITADASAAVAVDTASVEPTARATVKPRAQRSVRVDRWHAEDRVVAIGAGPAAIVATTENPNDGWSATLDGVHLTAVRVDGWRQGWLVPAGGAGTVHLRFEPGRTQRTGLAIGGLAVLALLVLAVIGGRRRTLADPHGEPGEDPVALTTAPSPTSIPMPLLGERTPGAIFGLVVAVAVPLLLAGPVVLVTLPLLVVHRRWPRWLGPIGALAAVAAGAVAWWDPGASLTVHVGTLSAPAQLLAATSWAALAMTIVAAPAVRAAAAAGSTRSSRGRFGRRRR